MSVSKLINIYNSVKLNLGIKRLLSKVFLGINRFIEFFDHWVVLPLFKRFEQYLFKRIVDHYGADYKWNDQQSQNLDKKESNLGYGYIHYALIRNQSPKRILCVGSMYGFIPFMMARACQDNRFGRVDFVDAGYDMEKSGDSRKHYFGQGFWKKIKPEKHFKYLLTGEYLNIYIMTAEKFARKFKYKYDYIYLDGDHSYKGGSRDFKRFWPRLKKGGYLCLHDVDYTKLSQGVKIEYWKLWKELSKRYGYKIKFSNGYSGLGIIQKL